MVDTGSTTPADPSPPASPAPSGGAPWDGDPLTPEEASQAETAEATKRAAWSTPQGAETPAEAESEGDETEAPEAS
jgi:hypothetical protein